MSASRSMVTGLRRGVLILALLAPAAPAAADLVAGNGELGVELGLTELEFVDSATAFRWGLRGGYLWNRVFELEGQLWSTSGDVDDVGQLGADVTFTSLFVNAVFNTHFRERRNIVPYGLVGVGYLDANVDAASVELDDSSLAFQVGVGSRFFVFGKGSNLALRLELSWLFEDSFDEWSEHPSLAVGLMWRIRGERD